MSLTRTRTPALPQIPYLVVSSQVIEDELNAMGLKPMYPTLLDAGQNYHYTTDQGWRSVAAHVYSSFRWPASVPGRKDCDFFAMLFMALVHNYFGLNACGLVIGPIPLGNHAFDLVRSDSGWRLWEPDPSIRQRFNIHEFFKVGEHGYCPIHRLI